MVYWIAENLETNVLTKLNLFQNCMNVKIGSP